MTQLSPLASTAVKYTSLLARVACFGRRGVNDPLPHVLICREVAIPCLSPVSKCFVPTALLSYVPSLTEGGAPHVTTASSGAESLARVVGVHTHRHCGWGWRQQQQLTLGMRCGNAPLQHQRRGMATRDNCMADSTCLTASTRAEALERQDKREEQDKTKQEGRSRKPRLICKVWRSVKPVSRAACNGNGGRLRPCSCTADLVDASGGGGSSVSTTTRLGSRESAAALSGARQENDQNQMYEQRCDEGIDQAQNASVMTVLGGESKQHEELARIHPSAFPNTVTTTRGRSQHDGDALVYNVFTHRVVKRSAASIRALVVLGIGVSQESQELDVVDPAALLELRSKLLMKQVSWPALWRSSLFRQVQYVLIRTRAREEAAAAVVEEVRCLLRTHYQRAKTRSGAGVVSNDDTMGSRDGSSSDEASSSSSMLLEERLFTYQDLNAEQQRVVDFVLEGHNTYIGGGAGTGKSLLLRVIRQELVRQGLSVAMTATTGIAATRIDGVTLHHCFGVNMHGECTRRGELRAFDVIIVDEVSMLSRELFESLEYQLRRANSVDLPFGGVQVICSGDFLQLGAIASLPLVHSAVFRRYFAMLKLRQVVRQLGNEQFVRQLQELRRGNVPHDLQDTITFLSPGESAKAMMTNEESAVKLLPTNKEVDAINQAELEKLPGELVVLPAQLQSPSLSGRWTATYILAVQHGDATALDKNKLFVALEQYVFEFVQKVPNASSLTISLLGQRHVVLYKLFVDAFVFRVRIPHELNEKDEHELACHLRNLETWLPVQGLGVYLREIVASPDGLHTDVDEYSLTQYAKNSPMMSPLGLKKGVKVMLRTNLSPGLVNGSLGVVVGFTELKLDNLPRYLTKFGRLEAVDSYTEFLQYEHSFPVALAPKVDFGGDRVIVVPPTTFFVGGLSNTNHYHMGIVAFPLCLAYAFTVHKVQGLTLVGRVHLELSRMWPCEHLLYVAMSRVRNPDQLTVSSFHRDLVRCATECLLFDESLPCVEGVRVLPHFFQATWRRVPSRRKLALRQKQMSKKHAKHDNAGAQRGFLRRRVSVVPAGR
ncbi:putative DNA repair and recombination protein,mitochondrial precursor [Trypanosoma rangeli]|uniref:ATP-dependent DNA helicase n=1 Tax=Trypanosoma rangeli TaxID=5698 RepID=A0A3R7MZY3_TRYRA|nr:putative DNA repair and recombination protein,mitochondrial precursor [Trypanosoma rangeli]RNF10624.1 putative DNA repair and recombination protein,mitochondrial precursor [Trypanosoma rangeli]|eukprot:RNF10624.1 putative DNA repair and recombination protein,mitochondrial precursor [Trypanosoma rangeli]